MLEEDSGPSELGTLEFWNAQYSKEVENFSRHGDQGEIWFGEDIVDRVITWMTSNVDTTASIVDIGCGNGHILAELARLDYKKLTGLDYSEPAIKLAKAIAEKDGLEIHYEVSDVLEGLPNKYDVIHDKGTYDAVCLSENKLEARAKYLMSIEKALNDNGYFIVTTCNWTTDEISDHCKNYFELFKTIPTPQFKFGGKIGHVVSICVFKKKK
ncbi:unnamed protein product [Ceutorhynchus assimilis]|uniref:Protein-lysine N-methyltransferase CEUTPL_LOCUS5873 n=1 Tax=Ceutorhynchus assimilis TaxID=467358 RepID=A0A9N9MJ11_9CUCU|nr:unnamed protein product [Ceutorhynchus assimilis]